MSCNSGCTPWLSPATMSQKPRRDPRFLRESRPARSVREATATIEAGAAVSRHHVADDSPAPFSEFMSIANRYRTQNVSVAMTCPTLASPAAAAKESYGEEGASLW